MQFASAYFLYFLIAVAIIHWVSPRRARPWVLLLASYVFYATCSLWGLAFLATQTLATYTTTLAMCRFSDLRLRRWILVAGLAPTLAMLLFVKYFNFANDSVWRSRNCVAFRSDRFR